jgi:hypothetical protein
MRRHDPRSRTQQNKWKDEFTQGKVSRHIKVAHARLGEVYSELYDRTIDYGAHPNERGTSVAMTMAETEDRGLRFNTVYLHADGLLLDFLLKTTAQVGICVLRIAQVIYPLRSQATGVQFQLETIAKRF